jgi:hypothetical protein
LIVEDFIMQQLIAANQADNTSSKITIVYVLVYFCNGAVVFWPAIQFCLLKSPTEYIDRAKSALKRLSSGRLGSDQNDDGNKLDGSESPGSEMVVAESKNISKKRDVIVCDMVYYSELIKLTTLQEQQALSETAPLYTPEQGIPNRTGQHNFNLKSLLTFMCLAEQEMKPIAAKDSDINISSESPAWVSLAAPALLQIPLRIVPSPGISKSEENESLVHIQVIGPI